MFSELGGQNFWLSWLLWLVYSCAFALLSCLSVMFISPHAAGSGIPEMRCILSGIEIRRYLSIRTLIAKVIGFISAYVAGMPTYTFLHLNNTHYRVFYRKGRPLRSYILYALSPTDSHSFLSTNSQERRNLFGDAISCLRLRCYSCFRVSYWRGAFQHRGNVVVLLDQ